MSHPQHQRRYADPERESGVINNSDNSDSSDIEEKHMSKHDQIIADLKKKLETFKKNHDPSQLSNDGRVRYRRHIEMMEHQIKSEEKIRNKNKECREEFMRNNSSGSQGYTLGSSGSSDPAGTSNDHRNIGIAATLANENRKKKLSRAMAAQVHAPNAINFKGNGHTTRGDTSRDVAMQKLQDNMERITDGQETGQEKARKRANEERRREAERRYESAPDFVKDNVQRKITQETRETEDRPSPEELRALRLARFG